MAHQNTSELVQEAPERPHDLAETLFKSFRQHSLAPTPRARRARARGALFSLQTPASGSRTQEPLRFPGRTHPPTSDPLRARVCGALRGKIIHLLSDF